MFARIFRAGNRQSFFTAADYAWGVRKVVGEICKLCNSNVTSSELVAHTVSKTRNCMMAKQFDVPIRAEPIPHSYLGQDELVLLPCANMLPHLRDLSYYAAKWLVLYSIQLSFSLIDSFVIHPVKI